MREVHINDEIVVDAPADVVWQEIKDPGRHARWHPFATAIEGEHRLGATRRCSIVLGKRRAQTREECTIDAERERIAWRIDEDTSGFLRLVSDWHAGFRLDAVDRDRTRVVAESAFRPRNMLIRLLLPAVRPKFHQTQQAILAALKRSAETASARP